MPGFRYTRSRINIKRNSPWKSEVKEERIYTSWDLLPIHSAWIAFTLSFFTNYFKWNFTYVACFLKQAWDSFQVEICDQVPPPRNKSLKEIHVITLDICYFIGPLTASPFSREFLLFLKMKNTKKYTDSLLAFAFITLLGFVPSFIYF